MRANKIEAIINNHHITTSSPFERVWAWLVAVFIFFVAAGAWAAPDTVWVDDNYTATGANDGHTWAVDAFATLQEGFAAVAANGMVLIADGAYTLTTSLYINKSVNLFGESQEGVVINANACGASWGIFVSANNTTLENFSILPPISLPNNGGYAIHVSPPEPLSTSSTKLQNVILRDITAASGHRTPFDLHGVNVGWCDGLTAAGSIRGNGIQLTGCDNITVMGCTTTGNAWGGLAIYSSSYLQDGSSNIKLQSSCTFNESRAVYSEPGSYTLTGLTLGDLYYSVELAGGTVWYANTEANALSMASAALLSGASPVVVKNPSGAVIPLDDDKDLVKVDDAWSGLANGTPVTAADTWYTIGFNASATIQAGVNLVSPAGTVSVAPGNYTELVSVAKALSLVSVTPLGAVITAPDSADKAALVTVDATGVSLTGFDFVVNQPKATVGVYMESTVADPDTDLSVQNNRFTITGDRVPNGANGYISFGTDSMAIAVHGDGGPTVQISGNQILPDSITAPAAMFDRAIYTRTANGTISGNTVYGDAHDLCAQFVSLGTLTVSGNQFLGKGGRDVKGAQVDFTEVNYNGAVVFENNVITPFAPTTPSGSQHVRSLMIKNSTAGAPITIRGNSFTDVQEVAILAGNSKATTIEGNSFTPKAGDDSFVHVQIGNKVITGGGAAPVEMNAVIQGNTFVDSTVPGGRAIEFLNHNATGATFGVITIGGAGDLANDFAAGLSSFIYLDGETQANSTASTRPYYSACGATVMAPFAVNLDATGNNFDVGSGLQSAASMTPAGLFTLEDKLNHALDAGSLGFVRVNPANVYVTTASGSIQRGIDAAVVGDTVSVQAGTFAENLSLNKRVALVGAGSGAGGTQLATAATGDAWLGILQLSASGLSAAEPVLIKDLLLSPAGRSGISVGRFTASTGTSVSYVKLDNVRVIGTGLNPCTEQERGLYVDLTSSLQHLAVQNCAFDNLHYGWYFQKAVSADTSTVSNVSVSDTTFVHNSNKGIYAEKLSDATFTCCTVSQNGYNAALLGACDYFQPWLSGVDLNLKAGTYANLAFQNSDFTQNALGGVAQGVAMAIKARGTGTDSSYSTFPATLTGVTVSSCRFDGNERALRIGEPGKAHTSPTAVTVSLCSFTGSTTGIGLINELGATPAVIDADNNWWGHLTGPAHATNPGATGQSVVGVAVTDFSPWLGDSADTSAACGFQPNATPVYSVPASLAFSTQPGGAVKGAPFTQQPTVTVLNDLGAPATQFTQPISIAIGSNPTGGILSGDTPQNPAAGVAGFNTLAISDGGFGYTLIASTPGLPSVTSAALDVSYELPTLASMSPSWKIVNSGTFVITINGGNFANASEVRWNGVPLPRLSWSATQMTATVDNSLIASGGSSTVTVFTPTPDGGESAALTFNVYSVPSVAWVDDGFNSDNTGGHIWQYDAFDKIQDAVNAVATAGTVNVAAGAYLEDVNLNKQVNLLGAGYAQSTITGVIGGDSATVRLAASGIVVDGFTITRQGNNLTNWENPALNSAGAAIQGQALTGITIRRCKFEGNRTAIDINHSSGHTLTQNLIVNNRTGLVMRNQTDNLSMTENEITGNWTVGVLFLDASAGSNVPVQSAADGLFNNNNISGNWYGQIVDRQAGGSLPAPGSNLKNFSANWLGTTTPVVSTDNSTEPGYAAQIPVIYGGTAVPPTTPQPDICGAASANIDYTPWLNVGTDTQVATIGFQGDFSALHVNASSAQVGSSGRIQEAIDLVSPAGTVNVAAGTFVEQLNINKAITVTGQGAGTVIQSPAILPITYGDYQAVVYIHNTANAVVQNLTVDGAAFDNTSKRFVGVSFYQASGKALNLTVKNIKLSNPALFGLQTGYGIYADNRGGSAQCTVEVANCQVTNCQKGGIYFAGNVVADAHDNQVTGAGATGQIAQNGIVLLSGASGTVADNEISGFVYTGSNEACGILVYEATASISNNTLTNNQDGVCVEGATSPMWVMFNSFEGCQNGVVCTPNTTIVAMLNWWGDDSGPVNALNPGATGAIAGNGVDFDMWLGDGTDVSTDTGFQPRMTPQYFLPDHLVFSVQPGTASVNCPVSTQPVVRVIDSNGDLDTVFNGSVTIALGNNPSGATLSGVLTQPVIGGVATFSDVRIDRAGSYTLVASSAAPIESANSASVDITLPALVIPADVTVTTAQPRDPYFTGMASAINSCGSLSVTYTDNRSGLTGCNASGTIVRTWTATDGVGYNTNQQQIITVVDVATPQFVGVTNIVTFSAPGTNTALVNYLTSAKEAIFSQGFEIAGWTSGDAATLPSVDWNNYSSRMSQVASGTDGIVSRDGAAHAVVDSTQAIAAGQDTGAFSRLGGYTTIFGAGYRVAQDVYLNLDDAAVMANTYGWDLTAASCTPTAGYGRDFIFHVASDAAGQLLVAADHNTAFAKLDLTSVNHGTVTNSGWYTFEWIFRNQDGVLAVDCNLRRADGTQLWGRTLSVPEDIISNIGGNRYLWFTYLAVNKLAIDNTVLERNVSVTTVPPSGSYFEVGTNTVTATANDACGNTTNTTFTVTVLDAGRPVVTLLSYSDGKASVGVQGVPGYRVILEASANLVDWVVIETNSAPFTFVDTEAGAFSSRFYRAAYVQ